MDSAYLVPLTRLGFAARGLIYLIIAYLLVGAGRAADPSAAIDYLRGEELLLMLIVVGFIAYGLWRLLDAAFDSEGHGEGKRAAVARIGAAASGTIYLFFAWQAWRLLQGSGGTSSGQAEERAQTALSLPAGGLLLLAGALILLLTGLWQLKRAVSCDFCKHLRPDLQHQAWVRWMGRGGYGARGVIFLVTAYFLLAAALSGNAGRAGGMEEALRWLNSPVNLLVAAGLAMFGLFSLLEAWFRQIHRPPIAELAR